MTLNLLGRGLSCPIILHVPTQLPTIFPNTYFTHSHERVKLQYKSSRKTSISALLTMPKPLTVWITINCGEFFKRWKYQTTWPASWEICMQVRKQQLELDMEQQIRSDQLLSRVQLFATPWIAARQASLSITNSQSSLRFTSIESVMPSSHLILCQTGSK